MKVDFRKNIVHFKEIESTNTYAIQYTKEKEIDSPIIIVTDFQSSGKGQRENNWESKKGENLLLSVILKHEIDIFNQFDLNVITSLSLLDLVRQLEIHNVTIKWPNDILVGVNKIAGVLIHNRIKAKKIIYSIIGVGININQDNFREFPRNATSIKKETSISFDINKILHDFLSIMEKRYLDYIQNKDCKLDEYLKNLYLINKVSDFQINGKETQGIIKAVNQQGMLIVDLNHKRKKFKSNQIRFLV